MNRRPVLLISVGVVAIVALFFVARYSSQLTSSSTKQHGLESVLKWGGPKNIATLPLIAESQNYFGQHGLVSTFVPIESGKKAMDALRTGDIDFGVLVDTNIAFAGFESGDDLRVLACIMTKRDDALLVAKDSYAKPSDLKGQTIGVTLGTTTHAYLVNWLEANGLEVSDVKLQNMPPPAIQAALLNGNLKAGCLWQPFRFNVLAAKAGAFEELKDPKIYTSYVLLATTKRYANSSSASMTLPSFIRALLAAEKYAAENQDASQRIVEANLSIPDEVLKKIWPEYDLRIGLNADLLVLLQREGTWIIKSVPEYANKTLPDYRRFLYPEILRAVDSTRVGGL